VGINLKERWVIFLVAFCCILFFSGASVISFFLFETFENFLAQQNAHSRQHYPLWAQSGANFTVSNVTVFHQDDQLYQGAYKPYVITTALTAQDYRANTSCILRIKGTVNNTGEGTAYDGSLHIVAMSNEGVAIDSNQPFALTAHMRLGLDFSLPYNGSAITNCTITPFYLDAAHLPQNMP